MKTTDTLNSKREKNIKRIGELIVQLHELHLENQELDHHLSLLAEGIEEEDQTTVSSPLKSGDRAVCLSPDTNRRGNTGHILSFTKNKGFVNFRTDDNQEYSVRLSNLFRLKKKDLKSKSKK